jgi:hypothetical protein
LQAVSHCRGNDGTPLDSENPGGAAAPGNGNLQFPLLPRRPGFFLCPRSHVIPAFAGIRLPKRESSSLIKLNIKYPLIEIFPVPF